MRAQHINEYSDESDGYDFDQTDYSYDDEFESKRNLRSKKQRKYQTQKRLEQRLEEKYFRKFDDYLTDDAY
jgi:hypothetical protein